jgi:hypothetical protein
MKLSSAQIRTLIPTWFTDEKIFEFKESFNLNDRFQFDHEFDFIEHCKNPKNWKCMQLDESETENFRVFNLKPLHIFGETFFVEITTDKNDEKIISYLVGCE